MLEATPSELQPQAEAPFCRVIEYHEWLSLPIKSFSRLHSQHIQHFVPRPHCIPSWPPPLYWPLFSFVLCNQKIQGAIGATSKGPIVSPPRIASMYRWRTALGGVANGFWTSQTKPFEPPKRSFSSLLPAKCMRAGGVPVSSISPDSKNEHVLMVVDNSSPSSMGGLLERKGPKTTRCIHSPATLLFLFCSNRSLRGLLTVRALELRLRARLAPMRVIIFSRVSPTRGSSADGTAWTT
ncbi:hypothetical protein EDD22DRAFT_477025 [Suillus occidentalis]|nr:hypothetical protein EDD22DRAFT_477025 [Suillus occidentalis]